MSKRFELTVSAPLPDDAFESADAHHALMAAAKDFKAAIATIVGVEFDVKTVTVKTKAEAGATDAIKAAAENPHPKKGSKAA